MTGSIYIEGFDGFELRTALLDLQARRVIALADVYAATEIQQVVRVRRAGVECLRARGGEVAATVDRLCPRPSASRAV